MATLSSLTTSVINYLDAKITAATATSEDIVLQSKALQQLGDAQDLLNAVSIEIPADTVDFSAGQVFTKTLAANTTLTFTNFNIGEVKDLVITGDYTLTLPVAANIVTGIYDGTVDNLIQVLCTSSSPAQFWVTINQPV